VLGRPAKVVREVTAEESALIRLLSDRYVALAESYVTGKLLPAHLR
jgi:carbonic anhydrase/acetyltransferase-like protein (isoleucine patch superfamily)